VESLSITGRVLLKYFYAGLDSPAPHQKDAQNSRIHIFSAMIMVDFQEDFALKNLYYCN
jgi:hypothetical protein